MRTPKVELGRKDRSVLDFDFCALFFFVCYNRFGVSAHYRTRGCEWWGQIAAAPHNYMMSAARKGINEWSN